MRPVASLLKLFDDTYDDIIIDAIGVYSNIIDRAW